jgi:hypothetical protein
VIANQQQEFNYVYRMAEGLRKTRAEISGLMRSTFEQGDNGQKWGNLFGAVLWGRWLILKS